MTSSCTSSFDPHQRAPEQFGDSLQIPVGVGALGVAEVRRENGETAFNIDARTVPAHQRLDRHPVAQVVQPGTVPEAAFTRAYADRTRQPHEYLVHRARIEAKSHLGDQKCLSPWTLVHAVAHTSIAKQCHARRFMYGY